MKSSSLQISSCCKHPVRACPSSFFDFTISLTTFSTSSRNLAAAAAASRCSCPHHFPRWKGCTPTARCFRFDRCRRANSSQRRERSRSRASHSLESGNATDRLWHIFPGTRRAYFQSRPRRKDAVQMRSPRVHTVDIREVEEETRIWTASLPSWGDEFEASRRGGTSSVRKHSFLTSQRSWLRPCRRNSN